MHSVLKQLKKFGTQSAHALLKRKQLSYWDFVIEHTLHFDKDGKVSDKKMNEQTEEQLRFIKVLNS